MTTTVLRTAWVWRDTVRQRTCGLQGCRHVIWTAENVRTGRPMAFERPLVTVARQLELETQREKVLVDLAPLHWASCAAREPKPRRRA